MTEGGGDSAGALSEDDRGGSTRGLGSGKTHPALSQASRVTNTSLSDTCSLPEGAQSPCQAGKRVLHDASRLGLVAR